jgi:hypothetical protein
VGLSRALAMHLHGRCDGMNHLRVMNAHVVAVVRTASASAGFRDVALCQAAGWTSLRGEQPHFCKRCERVCVPGYQCPHLRPWLPSNRPVR